MLNEIGSENLVGKFIRLVLSLVVARFRASNGRNLARHRVEGLTFIRTYLCVVLRT